MDCGFVYSGRDMYADFGIKVESVSDVLHPPARERKIEIPGRQGAFEIDWGDYAERTLSLVCSSARELTTAQRRELGYVLARRGQIILSSEPDKYYTGRIYDPDEIEAIGQTVRKYTLTFTCEPFLRGAVRTVYSVGGVIPINYAGTAPTPCRITLANNGGAPINVILVTHVINQEG